MLDAAKGADDTSPFWDSDDHVLFRASGCIQLIHCTMLLHILLYTEYRRIIQKNTLYFFSMTLLLLSIYFNANGSYMYTSVTVVQQAYCNGAISHAPQIEAYQFSVSDRPHLDTTTSIFCDSSLVLSMILLAEAS